MQTSQAAPPPSAFSVLRRSLFRSWFVVVSIVLLALAAALAAALSRSNSYRANAQLLIVPLSQDNQIYFGTGMLRDPGDPGLTAANAATVLHSEDIARATAQQLGGKVATDWVLAHVEVRPTPETNVLQVKATADSRSAAVQLAAAYLTSVKDVRWRLVSSDIQRRIAVLRGRPAVDNSQIEALQETLRGGADPTVQVAQPASSATAVAHSSTLVLVVLGVLGGLVLGALIAVGIDRLSGRIRDEDEARRETGLTAWGVIPAVPRGLRRQGPVAPSLMPPLAAERFHDLATHVARTQPERTTFVIISPSEGDGRTTTAVNLAAELTRQGRSLVLVLLDAQLNDNLRHDLREAKVKVIDAGAAPIATTLEEARKQADFVLIDGPAVERGADLIALFEMAEFLLVIRADHTLRRKAAQTRDLLETMAIRPRGMVVVGAPRADIHGRRASRRGSGATPPASDTAMDELKAPLDTTVLL